MINKLEIFFIIEHMNNVIVSPHYLSTELGSTIFNKGGNAVDAAILTNLIQGIVAPRHVVLVEIYLHLFGFQVKINQNFLMLLVIQVVMAIQTC